MLRSKLKVEPIFLLTQCATGPSGKRLTLVFFASCFAGCFCGLGLVSTNKSCSMPPISFQDLPLNIYMVIFGTGIFVFMLSLIFCCYFIRLVAGWLIWGGKRRRVDTRAWTVLSKSSAWVRVCAHTHTPELCARASGGRMYISLPLWTLEVWRFYLYQPIKLSQST